MNPHGTNPNAWNNWYHGVGATYGTWLRGDPRGFRTHRHRVHVDGDYRNPPPAGVWEPEFAASRESMRWPAVTLCQHARDILCRTLAERLVAAGVELVALCVAVNHFHVLARFPPLDEQEVARFGPSILSDGRDPAPRHRVGLARRAASWSLREAGLKPESPVWGTRPKFEPIRDRGHQVNTARYIEAHGRAGAAVWALGRFTPARG